MKAFALIQRIGDSTTIAFHMAALLSGIQGSFYEKPLTPRFPFLLNYHRVINQRLARNSPSFQCRAVLGRAAGIGLAEKAEIMEQDAN